MSVDEDLQAEILKSPFHPENRPGPVARHNVLFGKFFVKGTPSKQWLLDEQKAMKAAPTLGIRVPTIHRVVIDEKNNFFVMIMDLIPGSNVYDSWFKLSWRSTISLALQMRQILHALSTITSPVTGKLVNSIIESPWIEAGYPPARRSTPAMFAGYLSAWTTLPKGVGAGWPFPVRPNIFVHQDLVFRNIHVDPQNRLWVLDWGYAGYFPSCFESMAIVEDPIKSRFPQSNSSWTVRMGRWRWRVYQFIVLGMNLWSSAGARQGLGRVFDLSNRYQLFKAPHCEVEW